VLFLILINLFEIDQQFV